MFGPIGGTELLLILVIALIIFGPRKLPDIGKSMGRMMAEFRRASNEFKRTIEDEVEAEKISTSPAPVETPPGGYDPVTETTAPAPAAETTAPPPPAPEQPTVSREAEPPPPSEPR
jgi:Tat protein translocase TatB subunit